MKELLAAHMSVSGGMYTAFTRGASIGCSTMQVFVKSNNRWRSSPLTTADIEVYKAQERKARIAPVVAHAAYLINLCAVRPPVLEKSRNAFVEELRRCEMLAIKALIFHPGAHMGRGDRDGIKRIAESLNISHEQTENCHVLTTLEGTAGQGSAIGHRFEHLRDIIDRVEKRERMAVCLDTCHVFAAGYDIRTPERWEITMNEFDDVVGLHRLVTIHMNDSKKPLGSRVDRHEHIGKGYIGRQGFAAIMNDPRVAAVPKILETPKSEDMHEDVENLQTLRSLIRRSRG